MGQIEALTKTPGYDIFMSREELFCISFPFVIDARHVITTQIIDLNFR